MDPARIFTESLTPRPELENSLGPLRLRLRCSDTSAVGAQADIKRGHRECPAPRHASLVGGGPRSMSGSLATLAAMRRASSRVSKVGCRRCETASAPESWLGTIYL